MYSEFAKTRLAKRENDTFKNTKNPENFINSLVSREKIILDKIFSKK